MSENNRVCRSRSSVVCLLLISRINFGAVICLLVLGISGVWSQGINVAGGDCYGTIVLGNPQDSAASSLKLSSSKCGIKAGLSILRVSGNCCWWVLNASHQQALQNTPDGQVGYYPKQDSAIMVPCWYNLTSAKAIEEELCHISSNTGTKLDSVENTTNRFKEQNRQLQRENLVVRSSVVENNSDGSIGQGENGGSHFHGTQVPDGVQVHSHHGHGDLGTQHYNLGTNDVNLGEEQHNHGTQSGIDGTQPGIQLNHIGTLGTLNPSQQKFRIGKSSASTTPSAPVYPTLQAYQLIKNTGYSTPAPLRRSSRIPDPTTFNALQGRNVSAKISFLPINILVLVLFVSFLY